MFPADVLADPVRRAILERLADGEATVGEIAAMFPISQPAVSRHLRVLRKAGWVVSHVRGQWRVYTLDRRPVATLDAWLDRFRRPGIPRGHGTERRGTVAQSPAGDDGSAETSGATVDPPGPDQPDRGGFKSDRTRKRILEAAAIVLCRSGFDGARVAEIAALAGLRVSALYYYYESREALLEDVVNVGMQLAMDNVEARLAALPPEATAMERVCTAFAAQLEVGLTESACRVAAIRTMSQLPSDLRDRQLRHQQRTAEMWRSLIAAGVATGEFDRELDLGAARMFLLGAVNWAPEWWNAERGSIEDAMATIERLVRNALTGPAA
jgi:AcrR family transcriptional regulator/DNA-binding transcriptional ArsR family regulator